VGCIFVILLFVSTRGAIVFWWIVDADRWRSAFESAWVPVLGFFFLPATTLVYVMVAPTGNVSRYDLIWIGLAFLGDMATHANHFRHWRRNKALAS
jgi:hypothetical protein